MKPVLSTLTLLVLAAVVVVVVVAQSDEVIIKGKPSGPLFRAGPGSYEDVKADVEEMMMTMSRRTSVSGSDSDDGSGDGNGGDGNGLEGRQLAAPNLKKTFVHRNGTVETCGGVYICEKEDFGGRCYWGCYPQYHEIYPHGWWVIRIVSIGPDPGVKVYVSGGECVKTGPFDKIHYPGKNMKEGLRNRVGCFYVAYHNG